MPRSQHVAPREKGWTVRKTGADRVTRKFDTQREAIEFARDLARKQRTKLYIFGKNGLIRKRVSYGKDPFPTKGQT